jgi:hypothetical protein
LIWKIGDGSNIEIWSDPWLPRDGPCTLVTQRGMNIVRHVDELIDPISGNWDMQLVKDIFCEEDARTILALPVLEGQHNKLAWHFDRKGIFTVKTAYKLFRDDILSRETRGSPQSTSTGCDQRRAIWGSIWNLRSLNKFKHFLWRLSYNSHALRGNLRYRRMKVEDRCVVCQKNEGGWSSSLFQMQGCQRYMAYHGIGSCQGRAGFYDFTNASSQKNPTYGRKLKDTYYCAIVDLVV